MRTEAQIRVTQPQMNADSHQKLEDTRKQIVFFPGASRNEHIHAAIMIFVQ